MHLARLHQKHSSLTAAAAGSTTQTTQTTADAANTVAARPNNAPLTGTVFVHSFDSMLSSSALECFTIVPRHVHTYMFMSSCYIVVGLCVLFVVWLVILCLFGCGQYQHRLSGKICS